MAFVNICIIESEIRSVVSDSLRPHGILLDGILQWAAFPFSRGSSQSRDGTQVSCIVGGFFTEQPGKPKNTIALTIQTFVGKVMSLLFSILSSFVIVFLPRSNCLNFMAAVTICSDFGAQENSLSLFPLFPHLFAMKYETGCSLSVLSAEF